jgi:hypothetical protein
MGAAGSDVALHSADVALMSDRLDRLPLAIDLSRRALGVMRANVVASPVVKGLFVLLAPFGLVTLVLAVCRGDGHVTARHPQGPAAPRSGAQPRHSARTGGRPGGLTDPCRSDQR